MPHVAPVTDLDDPRVEPYREIRERDLAGRHGLFVAEGEVVLRVLLSGRSRYRPVSLLIAENRLVATSDLLARVPDDVPILVAVPAVMEAVAGFAIHRGILAVGRRGPDPTPAGLLAAISGPALAVGMVGLANHDNVGGVFRNAAAFGAGAVLLDRQTCDPLYRKAVRVSVGASLIVPFARAASGAEMADALEEAGFSLFGLTPGGRERIQDVVWPERSALLLGAEGPGLPAEILARTRGLRIGMAAGFDSLNVATASGIALHAASRAAQMMGD